MKKVSTPAVVIYFILALVVGSYLYYSQYHIPNKEAILINKAVRTLASIEEGISKKEDFLQSFMAQRLKADELLELMNDYRKQEGATTSEAAKWDSLLIALCGSCDINLWKRNAQRAVISNHVKPLPIRLGEWQDIEPPIVFNKDVLGGKPYLEIKHGRRIIDDDLTKALHEKRLKIAKITAEAERVSEEKQLNELLEEAKKDFFLMGGEGYGYPTKFAKKSTPAVRRSHTVTVAVEDVMTDEKLTAEITLDSLLQGVMDNEIFECLVLHSVENDEVYFSSDPHLIRPMKKFASTEVDSVATRFGVNIFETTVNSKPFVEFRRYLQLGNETFYLSGFIGKDTYNEYLREINYFLLILVLLSTFTLISSVPLIKVFVINKWERLKDRDVMLSALSLLIVVFLGSLIFSTVHHYTEVESDVEQDLVTYADTLELNFVNEIDSLVRYTNDFDFDLMGNWKNSHDILFHEFFETTDGTIERIVLPYDQFGYSWDNTSDIGKFFNRFVNLSERDYIQKVRNNDAYLLVHPNHDSVRVYLESVFSYSRAQKEAVISYPKGDHINGISVDLKSLMWTIPPEGFGYALIDRDMNVLFSSKKSKNNFKNLKTDLVGTEFIAQSINYGQPLTGHFDFGRDKFSGYVKPINGVLTERGHDAAFFLVTFANHDLVEWHTGITSLMSAIASFGILFASFLLLILQGLFRINRKNVRYFRNSNFYDSIFPERKDGITYLFLSTVSVLGVFIGVLLYEYGLSALVRYGIVQVLLFGLLRPLLLSYNDSAQGRLRRRGYLMTTIAILIGVIAYLPGGSSTDRYILLAYVSVVLVLGLLVHKQMRKSKDKPFTLKKSQLLGKLKFILQSKNVKNLYIFSMYAWILAILVLPFILISDKCEKIVANSFSALSGAHINAQLEAETVDLGNLYRAYYNIEKKVKQLHLDEDWENFMAEELVYGTDISEKIVAHDNAHYVQPIFSLFANRYSYDPLYVPESGTRYEFMWWSSDFVFFLFSLLLLYGLVRLFLNRIVFNISDELQGGRVRSYSVTDSLEKYQAHKIETNLPLRLFLVGIPRSRRTTILKSLQLERTDLGFIDFGRNTSFLDEEYSIAHIPQELILAKAIVIRFWFPEAVTDEYLNRLRKLTRYMEETELFSKGSVILSDLTITQIEDKWYEMNSIAQSAAAAKEVMLYMKEWFRSYREFLLPIEKERFEDSEAINGQIGFNDAYDDYLNKSYYSPIYFSVWHSLSVKERFIVYDLAEDGLMNARDSFLLMKLKRKGILSYNRNTYRMELFHRSFNLFVKNGVSTEEIMNIERFSKKNGSWGQIRLALLLLILAMLLFIYELMPNMFNALAGAIGVIASFSGVVSQLSGKVTLPQFGKLFGVNRGSEG